MSSQEFEPGERSGVGQARINLRAMASKSIGFVGAGNMAEAMIRGLLRGKVFAPGHVTASAPREERQRELSEKYGIRVTADNREAAAQSIVVLSVKPQILGRVLDEIS